MGFKTREMKWSPMNRGYLDSKGMTRWNGNDFDFKGMENSWGVKKWI